MNGTATTADDESVVRVNSKDELLWVENEVVVVDSVDVELVTGDRSLASENDNDDESKLWRYFTEHNSGQLKCNLCLGVFLYQRDASHLLKHIEAVHGSLVVGVGNEEETSVVASGLKGNVDELEHVASENWPIEERQTDEPAETGDGEVAKYFTRLDSGRPRCNLCCRVLPADRSQLRMARHLARNHRDTYSWMFVVDNQNASGDCGTTGSSSEGVCQKKRKPPTTTTTTWRYFTKVGTDLVQCLLCYDLLEYVKGPGANSTLTGHLRAKHERFTGKKSARKKKKKKNATWFVLDVVENGKKCLITGAQVETNRSSVGRVWDYFAQLSRHNQVRCHICFDVLVLDNESEVSLLQHLDANHGIRLDDSGVSVSTKGMAVQKDEGVNFECELTVDDGINVNLSAILHSKNGGGKTRRRVVRKTGGIGGNALWVNFKRLYRDRAVCRLCDRRFSCKLGEMSRLAKHLRMHRGWNGTAKRRNAVWRFFTRLDGSRAWCDLCNDRTVLRYSRNWLAPLRNHLRCKHKRMANGNKSDAVAPSDGTSTEIGPGVNMRALFDYFNGDESVRDCIAFANELIVCKLCRGMFLFNDLLDFQYTIKCHVKACRVHVPLAASPLII